MFFLLLHCAFNRNALSVRAEIEKQQFQKLFPPSFLFVLGISSSAIGIFEPKPITIASLAHIAEPCRNGTTLTGDGDRQQTQQQQ